MGENEHRVLAGAGVGQAGIPSRPEKLLSRFLCQPYKICKIFRVEMFRAQMRVSRNLLARYLPTPVTTCSHFMCIAPRRLVWF